MVKVSEVHLDICSRRNKQMTYSRQSKSHLGNIPLNITCFENSVDLDQLTSQSLYIYMVWDLHLRKSQPGLMEILHVVNLDTMYSVYFFPISE